ncbi:MAG: hypothetical protein NC084_08770 [Bacteroides sp.]|nr:hypothetical protein [Eubacterium sp.]MCM1418721.1 hypothetical protein [Roseburia sp.]MCM1462788.1 hypothetical protein [Bacteroides sp.]
MLVAIIVAKAIAVTFLKNFFMIMSSFKIVNIFVFLLPIYEKTYKPNGITFFRDHERSFRVAFDNRPRNPSHIYYKNRTPLAESKIRTAERTLKYMTAAERGAAACAALLERSSNTYIISPKRTNVNRFLRNLQDRSVKNDGITRFDQSRAGSTPSLKNKRKKRDR